MPFKELGVFMAKEKFEDALEKLEDIVRKMETGDMPLDETLKSFEEGIKLIRFCSSKLEETERRVETLLEKENSLQVKRFKEEESDSE
jgi:exodeoxyribonuclease VII small subunit